MKVNQKLLELYLVTDRRWLQGRTLAEEVEAAIQGGVTMVQLREKVADWDAALAEDVTSADSVVKEALDVRDVCRRYQIPFIINDSVALCERSAADGVHLGQSDTDIKMARERLGDHVIIGATAHNVEEAVRAEKAGADYIGAGAAFGSATKADAKPIKLDEYKRITQAVSIPVVAIGGITCENVNELAGAGLAGVAVISGILAKGDAKAAAEDMTKIMPSCGF